ncbi:response regulator [Belliella sp. R4-6]|uniref:Response regulator n=1 Tax=Belliella alkalica TaxID=1730871 RepID=A0ABS9V768_9BACT|nr:response regulator [Belliella alkalica]MCH7412261.1 response regulator [Belliella alkalica]
MQNIHILLVEDNDGDVVLTMEALEEAKIKNSISIVKNGEKAIQYIERIGDFQNVIYPDLIILDINLPKLSGHEVVKHLKSSEKHKEVPIIILTTSSSPNDIDKSNKNQVNCFITKPVTTDDFIQMVNKLKDFWINILSQEKLEN